MITPTAADMLKTVQHSLETVIKPDLQSTATRSTAATMGHMLRLATLRIEKEGQILHGEMQRLNALLPRLRAWLLAHKVTAPTTIDARPALNQATYPSLAIMADEVGALRQGVSDALLAMQGLNLDSEGAALLEELNIYIAWQLEQEGKMILPATLGKGPRR